MNLSEKSPIFLKSKLLAPGRGSSTDLNDLLKQTVLSVFSPLLPPAPEQGSGQGQPVKPIWEPNPGPQTLAYESEADELLYGGSAGSGKTDLALGLAGTRHHHSVIFRREFPRVRGIIERSRELYNAAGSNHAKDSYNESLHIWRLADGRMIEFSSLQYEKDVENQRGRPRDLYVFDELTEFSEFQYRFVTAWNRTTRPGQRCRIVGTCNPPTNAEGRWVIKYWGPWLDPHYPNPAQPGELRWFTTIDGEDVECSGPEPIEHKGEILRPRSRTFIPARLADNPFQAGTGYEAILQGLPEPLRSQMLYGDFSLSVSDDQQQVIPTEWVRLAQARWQPSPAGKLPMTAMGVDVARGGRDKTVIARRHGNWFAELIKYPGKDTPDGPAVAQLVINMHEPGSTATINVDVIGVGSSAYDFLAKHNYPARPINVASGSDATDMSGKLGFVNLRAEMLWKFREALDPLTGENLALPPDPELLADLCAARWELRSNGIKVESKDDIKKRLGRSPDCSDALLMAFYQHPAQGILDWYKSQATKKGK